MYQIVNLYTNGNCHIWAIIKAESLDYYKIIRRASKAEDLEEYLKILNAKM